MNILRLNRVALRAGGRYKLPTFLSILGVAIGVGAVVSIVAVGEGATLRVQNAIASLGANMLWVEAGSVNRACVGVFFGFYPAHKASRLDPIDALRFEV